MYLNIVTRSLPDKRYAILEVVFKLLCRCELLDRARSSPLLQTITQNSAGHRDGTSKTSSFLPLALLTPATCFARTLIILARLSLPQSHTSDATPIKAQRRIYGFTMCGTVRENNKLRNWNRRNSNQRFGARYSEFLTHEKSGFGFESSISHTNHDICCKFTPCRRCRLHARP